MLPVMSEHHDQPLDLLMPISMPHIWSIIHVEWGLIGGRSPLCK